MTDTSAASTVSVAKGKTARGVAFWGALGSTLPTDATTALDAALKTLGYVGSDGITNKIDIKTTDVTEMGGQTILSVLSTRAETLEIPMLETSVDTLSVTYGSQNVVKDPETGLITVKHRADGQPPIVIVSEILLTGGLIKRQVVGNATINSIGDIQYHAGDAVLYDVTLSCNAFDDDGDTMLEYIAAVA